MKNRFLLLLLFFIASDVRAQQKIENLIIITTDGFRWQEVFGGIDSAIANNKRYNQGDSAYLFKKYWAVSPEERRLKLMPFFWGTLANKGQVYGNRNLNNKVNNSNPHWFSYPGYSELFCGFGDPQINSNSYPGNPHTTLLDFLQKQPAYKGKIAAFTAWEAFNRILNEPRAGFPVVAAFDTVPGKDLSPKQRLINQMLLDSYRPWGEGECLDVFTHYAAMEYLNQKQPKVLYIGYGETDEWAHSGQYRSYLDAARQFDSWIEQLWSYVQFNPAYKNKTAMLITVDHGRGDVVKSEWTDHGSSIKGADETWFAIVAPGLPGRGEMKQSGQFYQDQLAQTLANLLGLQYKARHPIKGGILSIIKK